MGPCPEQRVGIAVWMTWPDPPSLGRVDFCPVSTTGRSKSTVQREQQIIQAEAEFWDRQEDVIQEFYDRPHDWRFAPALANRIIKKREQVVRRFLRKRRGEIDRILDIGCGSGWFLHGCSDELGMTGVGVDVSAKKIATANDDAQRRGLADRCSFLTIDIMELDPEQVGGKFDLLFAQSSLHHLPGLEEKLPVIVERLLRPGGYMLFCEPHYDHGMAPRLEKFIWGMARSKVFGRLFDVEFFNEVASAAQTDDCNADEALRGESPAGKQFFGEDPDIQNIMRTTGHELLDERYFHAFGGHLTNAFYIFMKSRVLRGLYRISLPLVVAADNYLCRFERFNRYAEEGMWFLRARAD